MQSLGSAILRVCESASCESASCDLRVCELRVCELRICELRVCELRVCELRICELRVCELRVCESASCESASCESASLRWGFIASKAHLSVILCALTIALIFYTLTDLFILRNALVSLFRIFQILAGK